MVEGETVFAVCRSAPAGPKNANLPGDEILWAAVSKRSKLTIANSPSSALASPISARGMTACGADALIVWPDAASAEAPTLNVLRSARRDVSTIASDRKVSRRVAGANTGVPAVYLKHDPSTRRLYWRRTAAEHDAHAPGPAWGAIVGAQGSTPSGGRLLAPGLQSHGMPVLKLWPASNSRTRPP